MVRFRYDATRHDFRAWTRAVLGVEDLSRLHEAPALLPGLSLEHRRCLMLKRLYDHRGQGLDELMRRFVTEAVAPVFGPISSYQERACLRIHMHGCDSTSAFHHDGEWGQQEATQNVWIPWTPVWGTNSLWVESAPGRADYAPVELGYGEAIIFQGAVLSHGSVANDSGSTRVSADVRVKPRP